MWKEWIVYHIKKRQFKNAMDVLEKLGWEEEAGLRDYVIEELKDESFFHICCRFEVFVGEESVKKWTEESSLLAI